MSDLEDASYSQNIIEMPFREYWSQNINFLLCKDAIVGFSCLSAGYTNC